MHRIILALSITLIFATSVYSQDTLDYATADAKTYTYMQSAQWDSVIHYGDLALKNNIDYFYLRVRLGMAYYYKQNYTKSIHEFEKAMNFNSSDAYTQEMLYYGYVLAGRESDALSFTSAMSDAAKKDAGVTRIKFLNSLYLEGGPSLSNNFSKNENTDFNDVPNRSGYACLLGNIYYGHLGAKFQTGKKVTIYAGFSRLSEQIRFFNDATEHTPFGRSFYQWDTVVWHPLPSPGQYTHDTIYENHQAFKDSMISSVLKNNLQQSEFYFNCNIHLTKGLDVTPFLHILNTKYTYVYPWAHKPVFTAHDTIETHTQFYFPTPPGGVTDTIFYTYLNPIDTITKITFLNKDTSYTNFSAGAELSKNFGHVTASVFGNISNLNGGRQKEAGFAVTYYPFGNMNLYLNTVFTTLADRKNKMMTIGFLAGTKITNSIWLESSVTMGDMKNYTANSGFVVNNSPDVTKFRFGFMPVFIFKNFTLNIQYLFKAEEGSYSFWNETTGSTTKTFVYQNHLITGGIKWRF
jgi:hypothetical protein